MHSPIAIAWIMLRCLLALAAWFAVVAASWDVLRSGTYDTRGGLTIRRRERPGRFWFYACGTLALSTLSGVAALYVVWWLARPLFGW